MAVSKGLRSQGDLWGAQRYGLKQNSNASQTIAGGCILYLDQRISRSIRYARQGAPSAPPRFSGAALRK